MNFLKIGYLKSNYIYIWICPHNFWQLKKPMGPGDFVVWDLEKRRMHHLREAHRGPITSAQFLPKEPLLWLGATGKSLIIGKINQW